MVTRRRRGFTLIELLVAAAVGVLLMLMLYGSMASSASRFQAGESGLEANLQAQRIFELLRRDIQGPYPWAPCELPDEVTRELGAGSPRAYYEFPRVVSHRITYYQNSRGPTRQASRHLAQPVRGYMKDAPCELAWSGLLSTWLRDPPGPERLRGLKAVAHPIEVVTASGRRPASWLVGPAVWVHEPERRRLRRWTEESGWVELGEGRVADFAGVPVLEWSWNYRSDLDPPTWVLSRLKEMLEVRLALGRDEGRPDLVVTQVLRKP